MINSKIVELSPKLFNMIAAGEVVERPASVVKELVENSIDASANVIRIELMNSGIDKITVIDNGSGMSKDDISQAIKPHATSKIKTETDLFNISTLGFRGEAIPSIASISKMRITSSTDGYTGYFKYFEGGTLIEENITSFPKGTKIEVNDIFFNTPARLKHLKSEATELSQIILLVNKIALAYPNISFVLTNNTKVLFSTDGQNEILNVIAEIYGLDTAKKMIHFSDKSGLYQIEGYTTNNNIFRSNKNAMFMMINNRIIKNQNLHYAIMDSYKTLLPIGRYPITILKITSEPTLVDVNVHPTKEEVRFTDEIELRRLITSSISDALFKKELVCEATSSDIKSKPIPIPLVKESTSDSKTTFTWDDFEEKEIIIKNDTRKTINHDDVLDEEDDFSYDTSFNEPRYIKEEFRIIDKIDVQSFDLGTNDNTNHFSSMRYIGQYNKTYLLLEKDNDLYLIDQHAAMERVKYEETINRLNNPTDSFYDLLVPIKIDLSVFEIELLKDNQKLLDDLGITFEEFGSTSILVRSIPSWINKTNVDVNLQEIFNMILKGSKMSRAILFDNLAKIVSCKSSIKANMYILEDEVKTLLESLDNCKNPYTCPHGRPTVIHFSLYEIEKLFKRVM